MDPKGFEKKPWFPYLKNMYDEIEEDMMGVDAKGYEEKPWWPYVLDLQEKIDSGGGGGLSDFSTAEVTFEVIMPTGKTLAFMEGTFFIGQTESSGSQGLYAKNIEIGNSTTEIVIMQGGYASASAENFYAEDTDGGMYNTRNIDITTSGDASYNPQNDMISVQGNCTITLTLTPGTSPN